MSNVDDVDKYIALCSDFLIKMKTDRDGESYYFRANKINYEGNKLKFKCIIYIINFIIINCTIRPFDCYIFNDFTFT